MLYFFNGCARTSKEEQLEEATTEFHDNEPYPQEIQEIAEKYPNMSYTYVPVDTGNIKTIKGNYTVAVDAVEKEEDENLYIKFIEKKYDERLEKRNLINAGLEKKAQPKHGYPSLFELIEKNTIAPEEAKERNIGATVFVEFKVSEEGKVTDAKASESVYFTTDYDLQKKFDAKAIEAIKATEGHWIPAMRNGEKVPMILEIPVTFESDLQSS